LECALVGFDSNGDWTFAKSSFEVILVIRGDVNVAGWLAVLGARGVFAGSTSLGGSTGVWVSGFLAKSSVVLGKCEAIVHESTVASAVLGIAVNELLFGEGVEFAGRNGASAFNGSSGGERPARTTLSLVLDWSDLVLGNPVD